ncbi:phosphonate ABC transporter ATP-binding protein [Desulfovibrio sp. Fe33]|uniref:phosphonate ABC transporter ATP-binding protein n=1 Tax=Desulfovibrio sp. Fe33 TaxID=3020842 RepID=UPI00234DB0CE|nr:phosphonate ABC transporter ATP-binding protein [Desulfovibrio sp. Fe33]
MKSINLRKRAQREALGVNGLCKVYPNGTEALKDVSVTINSGDFCVIIGLSGAGKSTLLRCMNRLVRPSSGSISLFGEDITRVNGGQLRQVRRRVGMIFQQFNLVRRLTVLENVLVGRLRFNSHPVKRCLSMARQFSKAEREFAFDCLQQVGIGDLAFRRADALSGGQQQRVAIARALAQEPEVFLADEPIASLDPRSSETVMQILAKIHEEKGIPVLVNLHHIDFAQRYGKRILGMSKGELIFDGTARDLDAETVSRIYGDKAEEALEELSAA